MLDDAIAGEAAVGRGPFVLHVVWHPQCAAAPAIAEELRRHFASDRYSDITGGAGVTVLLRSADAPGSDAPPAIDWAGGEIVAVVALLDRVTAADSRWVRHLQNIASQADERGFATRVFPIALEDGALTVGIDVQALRWFDWPEGRDAGGRVDRLIRELTDQFSRMLRQWLREQPDQSGDELRRYQEKIQVFLSHSKHDDHGEAVAKAIRGWFHEHSALASFLDIDDMTPGVRFDAAIEDAIRHGVLLAIYTDSYSSREWCRREAILAKRHGVPMLVVDCLQDKDDRAFPYLWNVPVVRMDAGRPERADQVASALLEEVFKDYLWQQRTAHHRQAAAPRTVFTSRPPELATAAVFADFADEPSNGESVIVHPGSPLGLEERGLFADILPNMRVCALSEWLEGEQG